MSEYTRFEEILNRLFKKQQIGPAGYMIRWFLLILGPFIEVYLHRFDGPDENRESHDHPWLLNITIVLKGEYLEEIYDRGEQVGAQLVQHGAVRFGRAEHRIKHVNGPVYTLFIGIGRWREWGFWEDGRFTNNDLKR